MDILSNDTKRLLKHRIKQYHSMKETVENWREKEINNNKNGKIYALSKSHNLSDNTYSTVERLATPPQHVMYKLLWIEAIDMGLKTISDKAKLKLLEMLYWGDFPYTVKNAAKELYISERQAYSWLSESLLKIAICAIKKGLIKL
ncbi:MAG: hypothetical protein FWH17_10510 [Oscillospiraceae bacterium]|nr:hypothetical protein [Oscillospiraceae bacterium]